MKVSYQYGKNTWEYDQMKTISKIYDTNTWEEIGSFDSHSITLPIGITSPIFIKFSPFVTDCIIVYIYEAQGSGVNVYINEIALYNDCKMTEHSCQRIICCLDFLEIAGQPPQFLTDRDGRPLVTYSDGKVSTIPPALSSQLGLQVLQEEHGVRFREVVNIIE